MVDTNGYVAPDHLTLFGRIPVSKVIYPRLVAASLDFHRRGYTFGVAWSEGGYRPYDVQAAMRAAFDAGEFGVAPYFLNSQSSSRPGSAGHSRHGFGLSVDVVTNAPTAVRNEILAAHGFHLWSTTDPNHFQPDWLDVFTAPPESAFAALGIHSVTDQEDTMPHPEGIVYQIIDTGLAGVKIVTGPRLTVMPNDKTAGDLAGRINHGLEKFPDYGADPVKFWPNVGEGAPLPISTDNANWLAATYGPQIPGGTIAYLWEKAKTSQQPATYVETVAATIDPAALQSSITAAVTAGLANVKPDDPAAIAEAVKAALGAALTGQPATPKP